MMWTHRTVRTTWSWSHHLVRPWLTLDLPLGSRYHHLMTTGDWHSHHLHGLLRWKVRPKRFTTGTSRHGTSELLHPESLLLHLHLLLLLLGHCHCAHLSLHHWTTHARVRSTSELLLLHYKMLLLLLLLLLRRLNRSLALRMRWGLLLLLL